MVKRATEMEFFFSFCNINYNVKEKKRERKKTNKFLVYKWMSIWKGKSKSKVIRECVCVRERMQLACRMWPCYSVCDVIVHQSVPVEIVWRYVPRKESEKTKYKYKISKINVRYSYVFFYHSARCNPFQKYISPSRQCQNRGKYYTTRKRGCFHCLIGARRSHVDGFWWICEKITSW